MWTGDRYKISLNGNEIHPEIVRGYASINRTWKIDDVLSLSFDMTPRRVYANPRVSQDVGKVALQRGPLIYCLEGVDNGLGLQQIFLPTSSVLETADKPDKLGGITEIHTNGIKICEPENEKLYQGNPEFEREIIPLVFIPYYTWANRGENEMTVWVHENG